jgi:hypothetical protein
MLLFTDVQLHFICNMYIFLWSYFHIRLHDPSASGSLVIFIKLKAKENVHTAALLLIHFK